MNYKIGIYGSNTTEGEEAVQLAQALGKELAQSNVVVITGACSGMPYAVASAAKQQGAEVWGFSPALDEAEHKSAYPRDDITIYTKLFYVPHKYEQIFFLDKNLPPARSWSARLKYRNVVSTIHADAGIIISGGWGSLNEFTNLLYDGKPIGVLTGSGGLADELPQWFPKLRKKSESPVFFSTSPAEIVAFLLKALATPSREPG
jgi:predicted Rossmann-fold nucleotide-binding protein